MAAEHSCIELDRRYRRPLQKFFQSRGCAAAVAQDLTQDVFLRVIAYRRSREITNLRTFVFQVAANLLRDKARTRRRWDVSVLEDTSAGCTNAFQHIDLITPERIVEGCQDIELVSEVLKELPARTQRIFLMYRIEQLRHRAIADRLGLSVSLVEKTLRGARQHLEAECRRERETRA